MKILVVGGAGYIGSHFVLEASKKGNEVTVFDDLSSGFKSNLNDNISFYKGSTLSKKELNSVMLSDNFDVAVHLAAFKAAGESMLNPWKYATNNIIGGLNLIESCVKNNIKNVIFSSSAAVYGTPQYTPIDEDHPLLPINYYGYSKLIIEQNLKWFSKLKGIRYASLRYFNAAGYDSDYKKFQVESDPQNLIPLVMEVALGMRDKLEVFGNDYATPDGTGIRDYIHVKDLAEGHLASIDYIINKKKNLVINLGAGEGFSVLDILKKTELISNKKLKYVISERRDGDPDIVISSSKKAKQLIGWLPARSDLDNIIKTSWAKYSYNMKVNKL